MRVIVYLRQKSYNREQTKQKLISNLSGTEVNAVIQNFRITAKAV